MVFSFFNRPLAVILSCAPAGIIYYHELLELSIYYFLFVFGCFQKCIINNIIGIILCKYKFLSSFCSLYTLIYGLTQVKFIIYSE